MPDLKQSTAVTLKIGPFVDENDGKTAETSLTLSQADFRLSKNGGDFAQKNDSNAGTHDELGYYDVAVNATDTNTLGRLTIAVHEAGALPVRQDYNVLTARAFNKLIHGQQETLRGGVVHHVNHAATGLGTGMNPTDAFTTITAAIAACVPGDDIEVDGSSYTTFGHVIPPNVVVRAKNGAVFITPTIDANDGWVFYLSDRSELHGFNIIVSGSGGSTGGQGVFVAGSNTRVFGNSITAPFDAIEVKSNDPATLYDVQCVGNAFIGGYDSNHFENVSGLLLAYNVFYCTASYPSPNHLTALNLDKCVADVRHNFCILVAVDGTINDRTLAVVKIQGNGAVRLEHNHFRMQNNDGSLNGELIGVWVAEPLSGATTCQVTSVGDTLSWLDVGGGTHTSHAILVEEGCQRPIFRHWSNLSSIPYSGDIWFPDDTEDDTQTQATTAATEATAGNAKLTAQRLQNVDDLANGGRLDLLIDAILADTDSLDTTKISSARLAAIDLITSARMQSLTDLIDGGRLDLLIDAIKTAAEAVAAVKPAGGQLIAGATDLSGVGQAIGTTLTAEIVNDKRTFYAGDEGVWADNQISLAAWDGDPITLSANFGNVVAGDSEEMLNPGTTISSVDEVTVVLASDEDETIEVTNLRLRQDRLAANFDVANIPAPGKYIITVRVTSTDGQPLTLKGYLVPE